MNANTLIDVIPSMIGLSAATNQWILGELYCFTLDDPQVYIEAFYASNNSLRSQRRVSRKFQDTGQPCVLIRDCIVMASRGIDNVTDVCEAMRADLARRMEDVFIAAEAAEGDE